MRSDTPLELRVEAYAEGALSPTLAERIGAALAKRWPVEWDITVPPVASREHPAEWRAVVPLPEGQTPEMVHPQIAADIRALDPSGTLHFRTRWDFPQAPDQKEVYEEHWKPDGQ
jgi:hypothetical protein